MDQYLRDSPSEYGNLENSNPNLTANAANTGNTNDNQFSLKLEPDYGIDGNNTFEGFDNYNTNDDNFPVVPGTDYMSPNVKAEASNEFNGDPFLDELDALEFPTQTQSNYLNPQQSNTANLDEIIAPSANFKDNNAFLNPQYFSPPAKDSAIPNINTIPLEENLSTSISNEFSPYNGAGIPYESTNTYDLNSDSYLSPANPAYMSPSNGFSNSYDTLRSPNLNGSYLNSPPQHIGLGGGIANHGIQSTSIPNAQNLNKLLSPPKATTLGSSAPTGPSSDTSGGIPAKHLTKEEKLKRRREFHNAVERRRRDLIKERIKELGLLVPPSLLNPQLCAVQAFSKDSKLNTKEINDLLASVKVKETKPNKSTILNKTVDYLSHLQYVLEQQEKTREELENKIKGYESTNSMFGTSTASDQTPSSISNSMTNELPGSDPGVSQASDNPNFLQDFQNQGQYGQYIKQEDQTFDPDEFFAEIITGDGNQKSEKYY